MADRKRRFFTQGAKFAKLRQILRHEGLPGLLGRIRYRRTTAQAHLPPVPDLTPTVVLLDHGCPPLLQALSAYLSRHGMTTIKARRAGCATVHLGWPPDTTFVMEGDLVILLPEDEFPGDISALKRVALVVDHRLARLEEWEKYPVGKPHRLAVPAMPSCSEPFEAWAAYLKENDFSFRRVLLYCNWIQPADLDFSLYLANAPSPHQLCLSLPETPSRRASFLTQKEPGFCVVDGLARQPGWTGTGASYQRLAQTALDDGMAELLICQDDVKFGPGLAGKLDIVRRHMAATGADMFSGIVTDVDNTFEIRGISKREGLTFVELNKSVGLVFNLFGRRALEHLAGWKEAHYGPEPRTIDRYLSDAPGLKILTCVPFIVEHQGHLVSSIWHFQNARYDSLIRASQRELISRIKKMKSTEM